MDDIDQRIAQAKQEIDRLLVSGQARACNPFHGELPGSPEARAMQLAGEESQDPGDEWGA